MMNINIFTSTFLLVVVILASTFIPNSSAQKTPPVVFILGDSTADVGTNNHLTHSKIKANFLPNGIDFPHSRPTGRFSNGFNSADYLAKLFGLKRSPQPFLFLLGLLKSHFHNHLFKGVNFASAGAGLLDKTNKKLTVVPLSEQITQFGSVQDNMTSIVGPAKTKEILCKSLFFISIGSNDIFDYFKTKCTMPKDKFIANLMSTYSNYITTLYGLGGRKFGIISVPPVGCCPSQRLVQKHINGSTSDDGCFSPMNDFALTFHSSLDTLLRKISSQLPEMKYSLGNSYQMTYDVINNAKFFKFSNADKACCGHGELNAAGPCNRTASVCGDRKEYLFWDLFHPTQRAAEMAANTLYSGGPPPSNYVSPITFSQLVSDN